MDAVTVVSAFAPIDRRRFGHPASRSGRLQDAERYRGSAHVLPTPRCRGNTLAHAGPTAQEVSELVVAAAIPVATENRIRDGADAAMGYPRSGMLDLLKLLSGLLVGAGRTRSAGLRGRAAWPP